jgi:hypothetical protein
MSRMIAGSSSLKCSPFATVSGKDILLPSILLDESSHAVSTLAARECCSSQLS